MTAHDDFEVFAMRSAQATQPARRLALQAIEPMLEDIDDLSEVAMILGALSAESINQGLKSLPSGWTAP